MLHRSHIMAAGRRNEDAFNKEEKDWQDTHNLCAGFAGEKISNCFSRESVVIRTNAPSNAATIRRGNTAKVGRSFPSTASSCARSKRSNACMAFWKINFGELSLERREPRVSPVRRYWCSWSVG